MGVCAPRFGVCVVSKLVCVRVGVFVCVFNKGGWVVVGWGGVVVGGGGSSV